MKAGSLVGGMGRGRVLVEGKDESKYSTGRRVNSNWGCREPEVKIKKLELRYEVCQVSMRQGLG